MRVGVKRAADFGIHGLFHDFMFCTYVHEERVWLVIVVNFHLIKEPT